MGATTFVMFTKAGRQVGSSPDIMSSRVIFRNQNVDVLKIHGMPSRSLAAEKHKKSPPAHSITSGSGVTAFALCCAASEGWWRRGDSNPRPEMATRQSPHASSVFGVYRLRALPTDRRAFGLFPLNVSFQGQGAEPRNQGATCAVIPQLPSGRRRRRT